MNNSSAIDYQSAYLSDYGFEEILVNYRRRFLIERLESIRPSVVIEIGCGSELLYKHWLDNAARNDMDCWIVVEPAPEFAKLARDAGLQNMRVIEDLFENAGKKLQEYLQRSPDLIICSALLHEVTSVPSLLDAIKKVMGATTLLHVNVPNAESMHRRLAKAMNLIRDTKAMSARNISLSQHRVYDMEQLKLDITREGFDIVKEGGYFIKPFAHAQMEKMASDLGENVLDGLYHLGKDSVEWASEIYAEARLA
jgi:hypothetical protein